MHSYRYPYRKTHNTIAINYMVGKTKESAIIIIVILFIDTENYSDNNCLNFLTEKPFIISSPTRNTGTAL